MQSRTRFCLLLAILASGVIAALPFYKTGATQLTIEEAEPAGLQLRTFVPLEVTPRPEPSPAVGLYNANPPSLTAKIPEIRARPDEDRPPPQLSPFYRPLHQLGSEPIRPGG